MAYFLLKWHSVNWKKGSAELVGLAITIPCIALILFAVLTTFQLCLARQTLEHAAYMAGRSAVVCDSQQDALMQANSTAKSTIVDSTMGITADDVSVSLTLVGGTSDTSNVTGIKWEKGALVRCEVKAKITEILAMGDSERTMSSVIYLMVERPAKIYY